MYKPNKKRYLISRFIKKLSHWLKRKIILILVSSMIGISNGIYEEDKMINDNQNKIEQEQKENDDEIVE
jgi:cell division protein FtsL